MGLKLVAVRTTVNKIKFVYCFALILYLTVIICIISMKMIRLLDFDEELRC